MISGVSGHLFLAQLDLSTVVTLVVNSGTRPYFFLLMSSHKKRVVVQNLWGFQLAVFITRDSPQEQFRLSVH